MGSTTDKQRITAAIQKLTQSLTEYSELILDILDHQETTTVPVEKKKKEKDPNAPKRNLSSYMLYSQAVRPDVVAKNPELKAVEVAKLIGDQWNALSDKEKQPYVKQAAKEKARFDKENKSYQDGKKSEEEDAGEKRKAPEEPKKKSSKKQKKSDKSTTEKPAEKSSSESKKKSSKK